MFWPAEAPRRRTPVGAIHPDALSQPALPAASPSETLDPRPRSGRRTLSACCGAHALHDGYTDLLNVLYPLLQAQFGLSYAAVGSLKLLYSGAMASGQVPSALLAE